MGAAFLTQVLKVAVPPQCVMPIILISDMVAAVPFAGSQLGVNHD